MPSNQSNIIFTYSRKEAIEDYLPYKINNKQQQQ